MFLPKVTVHDPLRQPTFLRMNALKYLTIKPQRAFHFQMEDYNPPSKSDSDYDSDAPKECRKDKKKKKDPNAPKQSSFFLYFNAARNNNVKTTNPEAKFVQTKKLMMSVLCCLLIMGGWNGYLFLTNVISGEGELQTLAAKEEKKKKNGNMKSSIIMAKVSEVQWAKKRMKDNTASSILVVKWLRPTLFRMT